MKKDGKPKPNNPNSGKLKTIFFRSGNMEFYVLKFIWNLLFRLWNRSLSETDKSLQISEKRRHLVKDSTGCDRRQN